jgi:DNA-binding response OmpR family regulator
VDAHVANLRKKIEPNPGRPIYVLTVPGVGYKLAHAATERSA